MSNSKKLDTQKLLSIRGLKVAVGKPGPVTA